MEWADADTIVEVGPATFSTPPPAPGATPAPASEGQQGGISVLSGPGVRPELLVGMPAVVHPGASRPPLSLGLLGARDGFVLFGTGGTDCCEPGMHAPAYTSVGMINMNTRANAEPGLPPGTKVAFAGWIAAGR